MKVYHYNKKMDRLPDYKYYVTMTDKFFSDSRGRWKGKTSKLIVGANTMAEAEKIQRKFKKRKEMIYVNIVTRKPSYSEKKICCGFQVS